MTMHRPLKLPKKSQRGNAESKALWNENRSAEHAAFFTVGYEGRTTDDLIALLAGAGVRSVVDIRFFPISRFRPELSKSNLREALKDAGIAYVHVRELGVPKDIRAKAIGTGNRDIIWEWYDTFVVENGFEKNLHRFLNFEHPVALMCVESDPTECHRHRLFMSLEQKGLQGFEL